MTYLTVKHIHLICILSSLLLFMLRGTWALYYPNKLKSKWIRILPHVIDTILLLSGLTLAFMLQQYPFVDHWLTAKVLALFLYIGAGSYVIKGTGGQPERLLAFLTALLTFGYIASVALNHNPFWFI